MSGLGPLAGAATRHLFFTGKGGVGKTAVAVALTGRGHPVPLSTTDPAAHVGAVVGAGTAGLTVSRIDLLAALPFEKLEPYRPEEQVQAIGDSPKAALATDPVTPE